MVLIISSLSGDMLKSVRQDGKMPELPDWISWTVSEASEKTGYNQEYIRRLIRTGEIEAIKIGNLWLVKAESLLEYLQGVKDMDDGRYGPKQK